MKKRLFLSLAFCVLSSTLPSAVEAIPTKINYQGTLKENGTPVSTTKNMRFRITNADGTQVYWSSPSIPVNVVNGLFSQELEPTGVNWQTTTPHIEVSIENQALTPREPINAGVYALVSATVVDGAITPSQVAPGYGLVPSGAILMFAGPCPPGWEEVINMRNRVPIGADLAGTDQDIPDSAANFVGTKNPSHSHVHNGATTPAGAHGHQIKNTGGTIFEMGAGTWAGNAVTAGEHYHDFTTGAMVGSIESHIPPAITVLFCKKI